MPILEIDVVLRSESDFVGDASARRLAVRCGQRLGSEPGRTWVMVREIPTAHYAEDGSAGEAVAPVFVRVLQADPVPIERIEDVVHGLTEAVADALGRSKAQVHVILEPPGRGRVAFGGRLVPPSA
jgi:phenylpyruvate tautomerase PptA (4-oxalocrotonate tautomerase family)